MMLLQYWKEIALAIIVGFILWAGYHFHTLQDKAIENESLKRQISDLQKANTSIASFDRQFTKETSHVAKTDCLNQRVPADIIKLLH